MLRRALILVAVSLLLVLPLLASAGCAMPYIDIEPAPPTGTAPAPAPAAPPEPIDPSWTAPPSDARGPELPSIADVVAEVRPSVVAINTEVTSFDFFNRPFTEEGAGSGWILDPDGIIVTNNHVVEGADTITVSMGDGSTYTVDTDSVFTDQLNDLAIIKIDATGLPALKTGFSSEMRVGDWVVAIGNALGQGIRATQGIVSRHGVTIPINQGQTLYDLIETSAAINPGNSGGPLLNLAGEVIGITSAKIASVGVEGMGYAISTETALPIIEALVKNGYVVRPWLGVALYTVDQFAMSRYELSVDEGVLVTRLVPGSPAAEAGLEAGDVITSIDGEKITRAEQIIRLIHAAEVGQTIDITYWRGETRHTTSAVLIENPPPA